jgi:hypothetical protein
VLDALFIAQDAAYLGDRTVKTLKGEIDEEGLGVPLLKKDPRTEKMVSFME